MALLDFKRFDLYRLIQSEGYTDENGDYHTGEAKWKWCCKCDVVPAGRANEITIPDGTISNYSYIIYNLPVGIRKFEYGDTIKIKLIGGEETELHVKGFHRYQLQSKIWA